MGDELKGERETHDNEEFETRGVRSVTTIKDIAKSAGVSVSTVSHVLNGYGDIGQETEKRVRAVMKELNYHPSALARRLVRKRSYVLELMLFSVEGLRHPFFYEVICGVTAEIEKAGYDLVLSVRDTRDRRWRECLRRCYESKVEGLFLMGTLPGRAMLEEVASSRIPTVLIDIPFEGSKMTYVTSDNAGGARAATEHLISLGHSRIAFIDGHAPSAISEERALGYRQALANHGIPLDPGLIASGNFTQEGGRTAMKRVLEASPDVTAVFAASDLMAIGAMEALREAGRKVPQDVAVVGFDDIEAASYVRPALSTIKQQGETMGRSAAREVLKLISNPGRQPKKIVLPTELVVRESCGAWLNSSEGGGVRAQGLS
ncbi:MAG: LacI family DNA-binding transcriptional regulator [Bacillota bacterium]